VFVGSIALLLFLLRYLSQMLVLSFSDNSIKEVSMAKTLIARAQVLSSSVLETIWAIGAGNIGGHLST
jgi:hypothetical protein